MADPLDPAPDEAPRDKMQHLLNAAEHALRSYENGNASPNLERERQAAERFAEGFMLARDVADALAVFRSAQEALEGVPDLDAHEFVRVIVAAVVRAGWIERGARPANLDARLASPAPPVA